MDGANGQFLLTRGPPKAAISAQDKVAHLQQAVGDGFIVAGVSLIHSLQDTFMKYALKFCACFVTHSVIMFKCDDTALFFILVPSLSLFLLCIFFPNSNNSNNSSMINGVPIPPGRVVSAAVLRNILEDYLEVDSASNPQLRRLLRSELLVKYFQRVTYSSNEILFDANQLADRVCVDYYCVFFVCF